MLAYGLDQAVVTGGRVTVSVSDEQDATILIGSRGGAGQLTGWTQWSASAGVTLPAVTPYRHLEVLAALRTLADLLTEALPESDEGGTE